MLNENIRALRTSKGLSQEELARARESKRRALCVLCIAIAAVIALSLIALAAIGDSYLEWDFSNPEYAAAGTMLHGFEWVFVRVAPFALLVLATGAIVTRKKG